MPRVTCPSCGTKFEPKPKKRTGKADGFDAWWKACPPKGRARARKKKCLKFWQDNRLADIKDVVIDYMERCCKSNEWRKDGGQFVPGVYSWLDDEKWQDETYLQDIGGPSEKKAAREIRVREHVQQEVVEHNAKLEAVDALWKAATDAERKTAIAEVARSPIGRSKLSVKAKLGIAKAALARKKAVQAGKDTP